MARARKQTAPATPAPFTAEQVAALNAGKATGAQITKVLAAHRRPPALPTPKAKSPGPIPLTEAQLRQIASERGTPDAIAAALDKAAPKATKTAKVSKGPKPDKAPPGY